jgi:hypothetical protein
MQREGAEDRGLRVGEAQEQKLEKGAQGTSLPIQTLHLIAFMVKYAPTPAPYKEGLYDLRALDSYTLVEGGIDRGEASNRVNN